MSHEGQENQGTGLREVFDILVKAPSERLLSLTIQLGESPEDNIIHALCLIVLHREAQALDRLQMLKDNSLANHLAEKWQMSGGSLEDFGVHCSSFQAITRESLAALARLFKVLCEQRLCHPPLRDLAYKRALSRDLPCVDLEYDHFREEAKVVCGPQFVEWMCSPNDLKSASYPDPQRSLDGGNTTLKVTPSRDESASTNCLPSPLQASPSMPSYPTHLEISIPPTASFQGDKIAPAISGNLILSESPANNAPEQFQPYESNFTGSLVFGAKKDSKMDETSAAMSRELDSHISQHETPSHTTQKPVTAPKSALPSATNIFLPKKHVPKEMHESKDAEVEEEAIFYAFVILHAPEDVEIAERIKERVETVIGKEGAIFSEDFAIPGKSTLSCVEDAINNSGFTFLLLTQNFSTRMLEIKTNSALINSINNQHKYNTVIPLLPQENRMPRKSLPMVLQTLVPLEENKSFERKLQKSLSPAKIEKQRKAWTEEQTRKIQRLKCLKMQDKDNLNLMMEQKLVLGPGVPPEQDGGDGRAWWQQPPNIHIENAQYIMIGNDSQMTVDLGGSADKDD